MAEAVSAVLLAISVGIFEYFQELFSLDLVVKTRALYVIGSVKNDRTGAGSKGLSFIFLVVSLSVYVSVCVSCEPKSSASQGGV